MAITEEPVLRFEVEESADAAGVRTTRIRCQGRLVHGNAEEIKNLVKPLIGQRGRIVIDVGGVKYLDSAGLGALVGLKVSALKQENCRLELENLSPWIQEMLNITNLGSLFAS